MKRFRFLPWIIILPLIFLLAACSPNKKTQQDQSFTLTSEFSLNGEFFIKVHLPENYHETDQSYPVLYMTDADWFFGTASDMAYMMSLSGHDFILVGIGYGDKASCRDKRLKDLGSDLNKDGIPAYTLYQSFLKDELFPEIESRYRASNTNRTYFGWSLGALFANHLLYEQRDLFDNYILGGGRFPQDWSEHMKNSKKQTLNNRPLNLYVGFPGRDASKEAYTQMIEALLDEDLADIFLQWDIYPEQGHDIESAADALWKGMRHTFSQQGFNATLMERVKRSGLSTALEHFEAWKNLRPDLADYSPNTLASFGRYLPQNLRQDLMKYIDENYPVVTIKLSVNCETLPEGKIVYVTGNHPALGFWNPAAIPMEQSEDGTWTKELNIMQETQLEYKFTLGSWDTEALNMDGQVKANEKTLITRDSEIKVEIPRWKSL